MKLGNKDDAIAFLVMANQRMDTLCSVNMQRLMHERSMLANIQRKEALAEARQKEIAGQRRMLFTLGGVAFALGAVLVVIVGVLRSRNRMIKGIVAQNVKAVEEQKILQHHIHSLEQQMAAAQRGGGATLRDADRRWSEDGATLRPLLPADGAGKTLSRTPFYS